MANCNHKYVHKETDRVLITFGRSNSRCQTWKKTDVYFCEKCLDEKIIKEEWCGQEHYSDRPDWTKIGIFRNKTEW